MWQRRLVALLVLIGVAAVVPSAIADDSLHPVQLPRPTPRMNTAAPASGSVVVQLKQGEARPAALADATEVGTTGLLTMRANGDPAALAHQLTDDPAVEMAVVDYARQAFGTPNDPGYPDQSAYLNTVRMATAWDRITNASSQVVAVIDTGVDLSHPDLVGRLVPGYNAVDPASPPTDQIGHGTMVAGIVAANTNNGIGVSGVTWNGRVMPVKVFTGNVAYDSDTAEGIVWATDHGAKVINLSLGGPIDSPLLHWAIQYAVGKGVLIVAASGNTGNDVPQYPAAYPEVLAVGATDDNGRLTDFSSFGEWVDLAAPGYGIISTYPAALGYQYAIGDGTSFASPIVAGIAALMRAQTPAVSTSQIAARLRNSARDSGKPGLDPYFGSGVVDATYGLGGTFAPDFAIPAMGAGEPNDVPARATAITPDANGYLRATGTLAVEGDVDWYQYDEVTARTITVRANAWSYDPSLPQNLDPVLEVYDSNLGRVAQVDDRGPGIEETVSLNITPGTYYIKVRNVNGSADSRESTLEVTQGQSTMFGPNTATSVGTPPRSVAIGDVTGDGLADVLVTTSVWAVPDTDYKLFVFVQQPNGTLAAPVKYTPVQTWVSTSSILDVELIDIDQDGRQDVALGGTTGVEVFRQTAAGVLTSQGMLPGIGGPVSFMTSVDLDGDLDRDLVVGSSSGITVLAHGAGGSFAPTNVTTDIPNEVEAGDLDGDGRVDIATVYTNLVRVYHNRPTGWVRTEHQAITGYYPYLDALEIADVTGDGRADVVATNNGNSPSNLINVFQQDAAGGLMAPVAYPCFDSPEPVEAADINGDGRVDVVAANGGFARVSVLLQRGDGTLAPSLPFSVPYASNYWPRGLALGDVNNDGRTDIATVDYNNGLVVLRQQPAPSAPPTNGRDFVRSTSVADLTTGVPLNAAPAVTFSTAVDPATVTPDTVRLVDGRTGTPVPATLNYDAGTKTVTITPSEQLQDNKPYRISVDGVHDTNGTPQPWPFSSTFRTLDTGPSALAGFTPAGLTGAVRLRWSPPGDLDQAIVRMAVGPTPPASPTAGTGVFTGVENDVTITGLTAGTTYSFAVYYRDRAAAMSPPRTATLVGTALTLEATSGSNSVGTTASLTFGATLTQVSPAAPVAGQTLVLRQTCPGRWSTVSVTEKQSDAVGHVLATDLHQTTPVCSYWWELAGSPQFMGATSDSLRVEASVLSPPGERPRRPAPDIPGPIGLGG